MTKKELFTTKNSGILCPHAFEFVSFLLGFLGFSEEEYDTPEARNEVLTTLHLLLELDVLAVQTWFAKPELDEKSLSVDEMIKFIDEIWFRGARFPDFYDMVLFTSTDWYEQKLRELGLTYTTDWHFFLDNVIGDLEKWIKENRPKKDKMV